VLFGATGFTGRIAVEYIAKKYKHTINWAIAARSRNALETVANIQGQGFCEIIVADSFDEQSLKDMCAKTKVVASTVGPFARYGNELVKICAETGCDYCDITGEIAWVRDNVSTYDKVARDSGARIVHLCGHDSVPWDLSTMLLAKKLRESQENLVRVDFYDDIRSEPSGGTLETALGIMFGKEKNRKVCVATKGLSFDPLLLDNGQKSTHNTKAKNVSSLEFSKNENDHRTKFFMAGVNAYAVKRSNALKKYGENVTYCEGQAFSSAFGMLSHTLQMLTQGILMYVPPTRSLMRKYWLPKPGEGPSIKSMLDGHLNVIGIAKGDKRTIVRSKMCFKVDPGYLDTARMLVESALVLGLEGDKVTSGGGVLTPAACQGELLVKRLCDTGTTFEYI
jgi:short subunit dehydrogenase-like uncharacterized protein